MKNTITIENFDSIKYRLLLTVSKYGNMIHPENWSTALSIYEFENESVIDMTFNYLMSNYSSK